MSTETQLTEAAVPNYLLDIFQFQLLPLIIKKYGPTDNVARRDAWELFLKDLIMKGELPIEFDNMPMPPMFEYEGDASDDPIVDLEGVKVLNGLPDERVDYLANELKVKIFRQVNPARGDDGGEPITKASEDPIQRDQTINVNGVRSHVRLFLNEIGYSDEMLSAMEHFRVVLGETTVAGDVATKDMPLGKVKKRKDMKEDLTLGYEAKAIQLDENKWIGEYISQEKTVALSTGLYENATDAIEEIKFLHGMTRKGVGTRVMRDQLSRFVKGMPGAKHRLASTL